jgi:hypothetical protein
MGPVTSFLYCSIGLLIKHLYCYFCSLLFNRYVDQTSVLLLLFSSVEQFCGSNHCPVTSFLFCLTVLWIKPLSCYLCFLLLNSFVDKTTVLFLLFSLVEQVCESNHCPVTSVLCCWNCPCLEQLSCYTVKVSGSTPSHGVPSNLTASNWRSQQGHSVAHSWHRPSGRYTKTTTRPVAR